MLDRRVKAAYAAAAVVLLVAFVLRATEVIDRWLFVLFLAVVLLGPPLVQWMTERKRTNAGVGDRRGSRETGRGA